jgi:glutaredoxin/cytochrome c biogenesis protein CcdA
VARTWLAPLFFVLVLAATAAAPVGRAQEAAAPGDVASLPVDVYLFHGEGCPHCASAQAFLEEMTTTHPTLRVHEYEVWYDDDNRELLSTLADAYGRTVQGVPVIFLGDEMWTGFGASVERDLRVRVAQYERTPAPDPMARIGLATPAAPGGDAGSSSALPPPDRSLTLPLVGTLDLAHMSLVMSTALIGLVDGVNPCSLWVLALLLGVVLGSGSRRRVLAVGGTFLLLAAAVYAAFIAGMFEILAYLSLLGWIRAGVAILALAIAAVNLKDYVAFGRGVSLTIGEGQKPGIYRGIRAVVKARGSWATTLFATGTLALGVTLVELPCTIGLPVVWSALVADADVGRGVFGGLLGLYMLLYLVDELAIFGVAVVTMRAARVGERGGRVLKLLSGAVMLALAVAMLAFPEALSSLTGTSVVFGVALGGAGLVLLGHRLIHPASSPWSDAAASAPRATRGS